MAATATSAVQLNAVADVRIGFSIRTRGANLTQGPVRVCQPRSITAGPHINVENSDYTDPASIDPDHFLRSGDLIFRTRGSRFEAALYEDDGVPTIAAAPLVVVRIRVPTLQPRYLQWFVNNDPQICSQIERLAVGAATIPSLRRSDIAALEIPVPPAEIQNKIIAASQLVDRQCAILQRLAELTEIHGNGVLGQAARSHHEENLCP